MKLGEQAARASLGFFFQYFDGKHRREDIVKALAKAATMPAVSHCSSCIYLLGAALWLLDYVEQEDLWEELFPLLPQELDDEADLETPMVDDLMHSRRLMVELMAVFMGRKGKHRQAFRKLWGLIDSQTTRELKETFKDALLDYSSRYLEVCTRISPSAKPDVPEQAPPVFRPPSFREPSFDIPLGIEAPDDPFEEDPARDHADLWFLMNTPLLVGKPPETVRKTLYFRRSSELMLGFHVEDPYAICAAYLLLERDGDVLANLNMLTICVLTCAEQQLPWGVQEAFSYAKPFEEGKPDCSLRYAYHPHENAEDEDLPDPDIDEGDLLSEDQLFYLATGYALPRGKRPSSHLKAWFQEQGLSGERAEALAWGAWFAFYADDLKCQGLYDLPENFEDFEGTVDEELPDSAPETGDGAARAAELSRQLKEAQKALHDAEQDKRQLQEQIQGMETATLRDRAELSQLRETLFALRSKEDHPEGAAEAEIEFPWRTRRRIIAFGGHDTWLKAIRPMLPDVRFVDREMLPDINIIKAADAVWIQSNALSHKFYYRVIDTARKEDIPVRYFGFASAKKCAEQLVVDEMAAAD